MCGPLCCFITRAKKVKNSTLDHVELIHHLNMGTLLTVSEQPFWKTIPLSELNNSQWEQLCDGCGKCCLNKLEDEDTGEIHWTNVACQLLDCNSCKCSNYENRQSIMADCIQLTPENVPTIPWLPQTCAYRLVHEGKDLPSWHHLISGDRNAVHTSGNSVKNQTISEKDVSVEELEFHIINKI